MVDIAVGVAAMDEDEAELIVKLVLVVEIVVLRESVSESGSLEGS